MAALVAVLSLAVAAPASALSSGPVAWGSGGRGQLGNGTTTNSDEPVPVSGLSEVTALAAGGYHSLALLSNGTVEVWGGNEYGQLGNGTFGTEVSDVPKPVSGLSEVTAIAAGEIDSFALLKNGTVMAWGDNRNGQLGDGTSSGPETCLNSNPCSTKPIQVGGGLHEVAAIANHGFHTLALLNSGTVMAWGWGASGQLGDRKTKSSDLPVPVSGLTEVAAVSAGGQHSLALLKNGTVMAWGNNTNGQLGDGTFTGPETCPLQGACSTTPVKVSGISEVAAVSAGSAHSLALLKSGTAVAWGWNDDGQLGNGTTESSDLPVPVSGLSEVSALAGGSQDSLALLKSGTVKAWGDNKSGQLGNGTTTNSYVPVPVSRLSEVSRLSTSAETVLAIGVLAPSVTKVEPNHGPATGGTSVTITGTKFTGVTSVKFGSTNATSFTVNSESTITAVSPAGTGAVDVTVTTTAGGTSGITPADQFNYGPVVTNIAPRVGPTAGGTSVTITGTNFIGVTSVTFGSTNATSFTVNSETSVTAVSPAGAGEVDVTVTTSGGSSETSAADKFSYSNPHYYSNGAKLKESEGKFGEAGVKEVIGWGTIDLKCEKGGCGTADITCHNVIAGDVWNPVGGGPGKGLTQASAVFDCETNLCAAKSVVNVVPENLPWPGELQGGTGLAKTNNIRSHSEKVKVDVTCNGLSTAHFQGSYQPGAQAGEDRGTGAAHPGFLEFDQPGSGELEEVELGGSSAPRGTVREMGYAEQEMIQAK